MRSGSLWAAVLLATALGCADRQRSRAADGLLIVDPGALDFARQGIFTGTDREITLRNGGRGLLTVKDVWVENDDGTFAAHFRSDADKVIDSGGESPLVVHFNPAASGNKHATLAIRTDEPGADVYRMPLSGVALDLLLKVTPNPLEFGRIEAGSEKAVTITLQNLSELPLGVDPKLRGADADEFVADGFPLAPGETRQTVVHFRPGRVGKKRAVLTVTPCPDCPVQEVPLVAEGLEQAVVAQPPVIDFGALAIDKNSTKVVKVKNVSTEPRALKGFALSPSTDVSFTSKFDGLPWVLGANEEKSFEVRFSPGHLGSSTGLAQVQVDSTRHPTTDFQLNAFGGSPELCVSPPSFDFGKQPVGSKTAAVVTLRNCGSANEKPLHVTHLYLGGNGNVGEDQFNMTALPLPLALAAGDEATVKVFFEPTRAGPATTVLTVESDAASATHLLFPFGGVAEEHAPCDLAVTPQTLDFGTVPPSRGAVLGVKLRNAGADLCAVKDIQLGNTAGGVFDLPGGLIDGLVMAPGSAFSFFITFRPPSAGGSFTGELDIHAANPAQPVVKVPLLGNSQDSCLLANPPFLDFGQARPDCPPPPLATRLENACAGAITVGDIFIGPGTTDGEFAIRAAPKTPLLLQPGDSFSTEISYAAQVPGLNVSPLFFGATGLTKPLLVPLVGESNTRATQTDLFTQQDGKKVDILFVVDNSASMVEEHPRLVAAIPSFLKDTVNRGVDFHIAVTTTGIDPVSNACPGGAMGGEAGRLFPVDYSWPRMFTNTSPDIQYRLQQVVQVGECANFEQAFEAARRALSPPLVNHVDDPRTPIPNDGNAGFLRDSAGLTVVFVSDEDDHSPDSVDTYVDFLRTVKGQNQPQRVTAFAIAPTATPCPTAGGEGDRYAQLVQRTGGALLSVCAGDYSPLLAQVADRSFTPQTVFPLSKPADAGSVTVAVDGKPVTVGWTYDTANNTVVFSVAPHPGAKLEISYRRVCGR